jgi:redox-sensitive bicupin YhaK (pirin superfamily)
VVSPFVFLDHFGPVDVKPGEAKGASSHPHAALTLLLDGASWHKDSLGNVSSMRPGEVQWLRAGRGVIHDERVAYLTTGGKDGLGSMNRAAAIMMKQLDAKNGSE